MLPLAFAATVPPPGTAFVCPLGAFDASRCSHEDLGAALADKDVDTFILKPGVHQTYAIIDRPVTIDADDGAVLVGTSDALGPLFVSAGGSGSVFVDLVLDASVSGLGTPLGTVFGATATFTDLRVSSSLGLSGDVLVLDGATVTLEEPTFEFVSIQPFVSGALVFSSNSDLTIRGGSFDEVSGSLASAVYSQSGSLTLDGTSLTAATSGSPSFLFVESSAVTLTGVSVATGTKAGWPLQQTGGSLDVSGGTFTGSSAVNALLVMNDGPTVVDGARFALAAGETGLQVGGVGPTTVTGATFELVEPVATVSQAAALSAFAVEDLVVSDTWFCGVTGGFGGAVYLGDSCKASECLFDRAVFQNAVGSIGGGGLFLLGSNATVSHGTFVGSAVGYGALGAAIEADPYSTIAVDSSLFVDSLYGAATVWADAQSVGTFAANVFAPSEVVPASFAYDTAANPTGVVVFEQGYGRCGLSVAVDGANSDPFIYENQVGAEVVCGGEELPGDGLDQDCDGYELCPQDSDGDGYGTDTLVAVPAPAACATVGDCDDADASVHEGCGPGGDADGDGVPTGEDCNDADPSVGRCRLVGGGCATGEPAVGWLALALAALAVTRRR